MRWPMNLCSCFVPWHAERRKSTQNLLPLIPPACSQWMWEYKSPTPLLQRQTLRCNLYPRAPNRIKQRLGPCVKLHLCWASSPSLALFPYALTDVSWELFLNELPALQLLSQHFFWEHKTEGTRCLLFIYFISLLEYKLPRAGVFLFCSVLYFQQQDHCLVYRRRSINTY